MRLKYKISPKADRSLLDLVRDLLRLVVVEKFSTLDVGKSYKTTGKCKLWDFSTFNVGNFYKRGTWETFV